jgi:hypothetical protein
LDGTLLLAALLLPTLPTTGRLLSALPATSTHYTRLLTTFTGKLTLLLTKLREPLRITQKRIRS